MLAAARAVYYTVLITDSQTARRLYQLVRNEIMK
jgi:DNA-binding transcriptional regulator LsrR (DeoR family)